VTLFAHASSPEGRWQSLRSSAYNQLKTTLFFAYFELKKTSAGTGLGVAWMILDPLVRIMIYVFIFTVVFGIRLPGENASAFSYAVYILMGLVPWMFISSILTDGANLVHAYAGFIRQPRFPYRILPNVILIKNLPAHFVGMAVLLVLIGLSGDFGDVNVPLLALTYALLLLIARGAATVLGACAAIMPDVRQVLNLLLMLAIYLSPILYLPSMLGQWIVIGMLNPFSYVLTSFKYALSGDTSYTMLGPWPDLLVMALLAAAAFLVERQVMKGIRHTGIDRVA